MSIPFEPTGSMSGLGCGDQQCCSDEQLISHLDVALASIVQALEQINQTLYTKLKGPCDNIEECIDKIASLLKQKWERGMSSCEECQSMVAAGLGGTIEFALACAGVTCNEASKTCSLGDPSTWDQPCKGCGKDPCCCNQGVCEPCPTETKKQVKYKGWCDQTTGLFFATEENADPPTVNAIPVSVADTEEVALQEAAEYCTGYRTPEQPGLAYPFSSPTVGTPFCDLLAYSSGEALGLIAASGADVAITGGIAEVYDAIGRIGLDGISIGNAGRIAEGVWSAFVKSAPKATEIFAPALAKALGCDNPQFIQTANLLASFGLAQKLTGINFSEYLTPYNYAMSSACRQKFLDPDKAIAAFLGNAIDFTKLDAQWAINGYCPESLQWYLTAARSKPIPNDLANLRLRRIITPQQYTTSMRELGFLEPDVSENLFKLHQQLPTLSDIIRLMVRDADDEQLVNRLGLDTQFDRKYGRQLRDWSEQQGVPELFAKYAWRAHWTIPSPTQLFEFWRRLRKNPDFGGEDALWQDIESALIQQDILPYWHKHYKAVNYLPMGRIDIRRSYNIGSMSDDELVPAYTQLGYSDDTADKLASFTRRLRNDAIVGHRFVKMWIKLTITRDEARQRLVDYGFPNEVVNRALDDAEHQFITSTYATAFIRGDLQRNTFVASLVNIGVRQQTASNIAEQLALKIIHHPSLDDYYVGIKERDNAMNDMVAFGMNTDIVNRLLTNVDQRINHSFVVSCQKGIKRRYLMGELEKMDAANELVNRGTTQTRAQKLVDWWDCERGSHGRTIAASKLCNWLGSGIISSIEFLNRLKRLGYSDIDAGRIMNDCLISTNQKILRQAQKDAKQQASDDQRAANATRKALALAQREETMIVRARNAAAATKGRRDRQLMSAAERINKKCTCEIYDALIFVRENQRRIVSEYGLDIDESLQVLILSTEDWLGGDLTTLTPIINANASTIQIAALSPPIDPLAGIPTTNGSIQPS